MTTPYRVVYRQKTRIDIPMVRTFLQNCNNVDTLRTASVFTKSSHVNTARHCARSRLRNKQAVIVETARSQLNDRTPATALPPIIKHIKTSRGPGGPAKTVVPPNVVSIGGPSGHAPYLQLKPTRLTPEAAFKRVAPVCALM